VIRTIMRFGVLLVLSVASFSFGAALPADAASGPTVIAAHHEAPEDVRGNATFGTILSVSLPAGNWLVSASGLMVGTDSLNTFIECQLVVYGGTIYKGRTWTSPGGVHSVQPILLLWGAHYAAAGKATFKCYSTAAATGDVLIRDAHLVAVKVGTLTTNAGTSAASGPRGYSVQDMSGRLTTGNMATNDEIQTLNLPAGRWLVQATGWYLNADLNSDAQLACRIFSGAADGQAATWALHGGAPVSLGLQAVVVLGSPGTVHLQCSSSVQVATTQTAINALKIGTLRYGQLGSPQTTTGSGTPVVDAVYTETPGYVASGDSLKSTASHAFAAGNWVTTVTQTLLNSTPATEACQLSFGGGRSLQRAKVAYTNSTVEAAWYYLTLGEHLSSKQSARVACDQTGPASEVLWWHLRIIGLEAGSLNDTGE
jgi:hypothetical protein